MRVRSFDLQSGFIDESKQAMTQSEDKNQNCRLSDHFEGSDVEVEWRSDVGVLSISISITERELKSEFKNVWNVSTFVWKKIHRLVTETNKPVLHVKPIKS